MEIGPPGHSNETSGSHGVCSENNFILQSWPMTYPLKYAHGASSEPTRMALLFTPDFKKPSRSLFKDLYDGNFYT